MAALVAGLLTFAIVQLAFEILWGAGGQASWIASVGLTIAAAYAAATMRKGLAVMFGLLGVIWVMLEALGLLLAIAAGTVG